MAQLGGRSIFLGASDGAIGQRESVADFARTLSEYVDVVALRVFSHRTLEEFAAHSRIPVINALSDPAHPCQALGDLLTIQEVFGSVKGRTVVFVGDGNNVARSLALACGKLGARFVLSAPEGYRFDEPFLQDLPPPGAAGRADAGRRPGPRGRRRRRDLHRRLDEHGPGGGAREAAAAVRRLSRWTRR